MAKCFVSILSVLCILGAVSAQYTPSAVLYSNTGCSGAFVSLPTNAYTPDLASLQFDNRAYSVSITGTWLFYDSRNFNDAGEAGMEYIFEATSQCVNFLGLGGFVSSTKFVGTTYDYRLDTITFFENTYFQAEEEYVETYDIPNLSLYGRISSLIVTGSSAWTIYDQPNYLGSAICLQPEFSPTYEPAFVPDTILLNPTVPHGSIASVRRGCFTDKFVKLAVSKSSGAHSNLIKSL